MDYKIVQIIPAQAGWEAVFAQEDGSYRAVPIACWALIDEEQYQQVVGMIPSAGDRMIISAQHHEPGFMGYNHPGCTVDWTEEAREMWRARHGDR